MIAMKWLTLGFVCVLLLSFGYSYAKATQTREQPAGQNWSTARRDSARIAPDPHKLKSIAIVQVYTAPTYGWRGLVAVHPWIIFKREGETEFTRYDVISWGSTNVVRRDYAIPDGYWFGSQPKLLVEHRGAEAEAMIPKIEAAIKSYPFPHTYHAWLGILGVTLGVEEGIEVNVLGLNLGVDIKDPALRLPFVGRLG